MSISRDLFILFLLLCTSAFAEFESQDKKNEVLKNRVSAGVGLPLIFYTVSGAGSLFAEYERETETRFSYFAKSRYASYVYFGQRETRGSAHLRSGKELIAGLKYVISSDVSSKIKMFLGYGIGSGKFSTTIGPRFSNGEWPRIDKVMTYETAMIGFEGVFHIYHDMFFIAVNGHLAKVFYSENGLPEGTNAALLNAFFPVLQLSAGVLF